MPIIEAQHMIDTVRPPRVQITYDVETGGAIQEVELPFVMGIMADLAGNTPNKVLLKDRKFVEIDRDNFNQIMRAIAPTLTEIQVKRVIPYGNGTAPGDNDQLSAPLNFDQLDDFGPANVVKQVPELDALLRERQLLRDLLAKIQGNEDLYEALVDYVNAH
jgi:type VI secretion system protein ImpB